jgi:hypothetical protein
MGILGQPRRSGGGFADGRIEMAALCFALECKEHRKQQK